MKSRCGVVPTKRNNKRARRVGGRARPVRAAGAATRAAVRVRKPKLAAAAGVMRYGNRYGMPRDEHPLDGASFAGMLAAELRRQLARRRRA